MSIPYRSRSELHEFNMLSRESDADGRGREVVVAELFIAAILAITGTLLWWAL